MSPLPTVSPCPGASPIQRLLDALGVRDCDPRQSGTGWRARCPAHDDRLASLSVNEGRDGRALLHCHAGCELAAVLRPLGLSKADLMPPRAPGHAAPSRHFDYRDEGGALLFRVQRCAGKRFFQQRPNGRGGWINGLRGVRRVPYRLPEALGSIALGEPLYVVEGEKDAEALVAHGLSATCNPGGAGKWREEFTALLSGAKAVRVLGDNDDAGRKHSEQVAASFHRTGLTDLRVTSFEDLSEHGDVSEWLALPAQAALSVEARRAALVARIEAAPCWPPPAAASPARRKEQRQGRRLSLVDPEPWPEPVDGPALFADLASVLKRYIVLDPHVTVTVALWVAMTYLVEVVEVLPRLLISSPTLACGKTRLFSLLGAMVRRPVLATGISPAAYFRIIQADSPTLLLDEMDNARLDDNPDLRALLNSGHTRTSAWTYRCVGESLEARRFSTWAPVAFAAIGKLPDTVTSRCVQGAMRRRTAAERVDRLRESRVGDQLEPLRGRLARWCRDHAQAIGETDPPPPDGIGDRDADNWTPLLAIAGEIGGGWPALAVGAALALSGAAPTADESAELIADMRVVFGDEERTSTEDALRALTAMEERPWADWRHGRPLSPRGLAGLLKNYGISLSASITGEQKAAPS